MCGGRKAAYRVASVQGVWGECVGQGQWESVFQRSSSVCELDVGGSLMLPSSMRSGFNSKTVSITLLPV